MFRRPWRLPPGAEANSRLLSGVRDLVRVHLGGGRHLRDIRPSAADRGTSRDLAVGDRGGRADARGAGDSAVRGAHRAHRLVVPMGLAAGQPEDRLVVRLAELLLPGDRRGGLDNALASQAFMPLFGLEPDERTARLITLAVLLVQAVLTVASTRIVGIVNSSAVVVEVAIVAVLVIALAVAVTITRQGSVDNLTSRGITAGNADYFALGGGLMLATIMGLATLVGFDAAANLAEEAKDPYRTVPRAIVGSVVAAGVLGTGVPDRAHRRDHRSHADQRQRLAGRGDHARSARSGGGDDAAGHGHVRVLRRRDGDDGDSRTAGVRDVARRPFSGSPADAAGQPAHADADPGDDPDLRRGGCPDGRAAG